MRTCHRGSGPAAHGLVSAVLLVVQAWLAATSTYLLGMTGAAWWARRAGNAETRMSPDATHRFAVLVPAHDEEVVIRSSVASLVALDYPPDLFDVHVVADNCTDGTAALARAAGATVHERDEPGARGKGPALGWLLDRLGAAGVDHDAYVVVDADSVLDPRFLRVADAHLSAGARVIQGHYTVRDPSASWSAGLRFAALAVRHYLRPLARTSLGTSAGLFGNGMVFAADVLAIRRFSNHLTEDIELHMELLLAGERVTFAADAVVAAEMPDTLAAARSQHERWERGRLELARRYLPRLVRRPTVDRRGQRLAQLDAAAEHLVAPFSIVVGATAGAGVASRLLLGWRGSPLARANAALAGVLVAAQAVYVLYGLRLVRAPRSVYLALLRAPVLVAWKLALLARTVVAPGRAEWTRTSRNVGPVPPGREPVGPLAVVLGVPVEDVSLEDAVDRCVALVEAGRATGRTHQVTTVNVDFLLGAKRDPVVLEILQRADLAIPDGMPIVWASRLMDTPLRQRVAGADLVPALAASAVEHGYSMYLFGSAPGVAEDAAQLLRRDHPGLQVVGVAGPVFEDVADMDEEVLDAVAAAAPDILCVALGHPKQELWIAAHRARLGVPVMVGVGGSLDFLVGRKRRAPMWMQRSGLEWLHRVATEPSRLAGRYGHALLHFPRLLLWEVTRTSPGPPPESSTGWLERRGGPAVLRLESGLDLFNHALPSEVQAVLDDHRPLIVDLGLMSRLDRVTVASLILLARRARTGGDALVLVGVSEPARRTLRALRVDGLFAGPDEAAAVASAGVPPTVVVEGSRRSSGDDQRGFRYAAGRREPRAPF